MKKIRASDSEKRWKALLDRKMPPHSAKQTTSTDGTDPFDCSEMEVPPPCVMVDRVLNDYIRQWKHLEERRVVDMSLSNPTENASTTMIEGEEEAARKRKRADEVPVPSKRRQGWDARRLRLPENFDYATRQSSPPPDTGDGERVVSLQNPSGETLSFERELWKIFQSVPTLEQLESHLASRTKCTNMRNVHAEITTALQNNPRTDGHALARMRMRDRHGLPPEPPFSTSSDDTLKRDDNHATMIRLECWRRQLRRGPSPDAYRMELEFLGTQTLQDVHDAIVELTGDELWREARATNATTSGGTDSAYDDSGVFMIEDDFYTTGSEDYVDPITRWFDEPRCTFLGMKDKSAVSVEPMANVRLDQIAWKLGVRYYHCHHGDVECSIFLTDIRYGPISTMSSYPIVHDVWTQSYPWADCDACRRRPAEFVSSASNEKTDGGPRALCESCCKQLRLPTNDRSVLQRYSVWREQADLSVGHDFPDALY